MAQSTVSLPVLQLRSRRDDLEVNIRGSLLLGFPEALVGTDNLPAISTIEELEHLVENQQAWINRVGPCMLRFSSLTSAQLSHAGLTKGEIRACILGCPVWDPLGLHLVDTGQDAEDVVFSVQHPVLSSSLLPPKGALTLELKEMRVALEFSRADQAKFHRRNKNTGHELTVQEQQLAPNVNTEDLQAIEDFLSRAGISTPEWSPASSSTSRITHDWLGHCSLPKPGANFSILVPSAIKALLFGKQKRHVGVKWVEGVDWDGLVQLAPAVFHVPYLEIVTQRAKFMPAIAMSLARMVDAESPSVRKLAASFERIHLSTDDDLSYESQRDTRDVVSGIEQSIWRTIVKHTMVPKVATSGTKRRQHDPLVREDRRLSTSTALTSDYSRTMEFHFDTVLQANSHIPVDILQMGDGFYDEPESPILKLTVEGDHCLRSAEHIQSFHEELPFRNQYREDATSSVLTLNFPASLESRERLEAACVDPLLTVEQDLRETYAEVQAIDYGKAVWHDGTQTLLFGAAGQYN